MGGSPKSQASRRRIRTCLEVFLILILSLVFSFVLCLTISFFNISSSQELILPQPEKAQQNHDHVDSRQLLAETLGLLRNITDIENGTRPDLINLAFTDQSRCTQPRSPQSHRHNRVQDPRRQDRPPPAAVTNGLLQLMVGSPRYLGVGLGNGTIQGLKINAANLQPKTVVLPPSDVNATAEMLGEGITAELIGSLNLASLFPNTDDQRNLAIRSLSQGLGSGAAAGLNLKPMDTTAFDTAGINGIAGNLGQGLTSSFLGAVDFPKVLSTVMGNLMSPEANEAALSLAQGLGSGAASALQLTDRQAGNVSFRSDGLNGIAGNFGQGLTTSLLNGVDLNTVISQVTGRISGQTILKVAQGLGSGLGDGAVIGLDIKPDSEVPAPEAPGDPDVAVVLEMFGRGLTGSFLANDTLSKLLSKAADSMSLVAGTRRIAEGFSVGLVDGVQQSIENAGGISRVFDLNPDQMVGMMPLPTSSTYSDTVGGVAVGLGNGLGFEFAKGILQSLGTPSLDPNSVLSSGIFNSSVSKHKRSFSVKRADQTPIAPSRFNALTISTALDAILQIGVDTLSCEGIGGVSTIIHALKGSKAFNGDRFRDLTAALGALSNQTYTIADGGNTYTINVEKRLFTVNGNSLKRHTDLTIAHYTFASIAYVLAIPVILILNSVRNLGTLTGSLIRYPFLLKTQKWQLLIGLAVVFPALLITAILGILAEGKRSHFYSAHGILSIALSLLRPPHPHPRITLAHTLNLTLLFALTPLTVLTGFLDLSSISSCIFQFLPQTLFVVSGILFAAPLVAAVTLNGVERGLLMWGFGGDEESMGRVLSGNGSRKKECLFGREKGGAVGTTREVGGDGDGRGERRPTRAFTLLGRLDGKEHESISNPTPGTSGAVWI
ncbi:hypothetical protein DL98DRAFT_603219 [Cadophora sp. DSE1049]|nr:hypothetical protein DL98DRAFT_603219 [Cadophora sp. DSE1049]